MLDVLARYGGPTPGYLIEPSRPSAKGPYRFNIRKGFQSVLKATGKALGETEETAQEEKLASWVTPHVLRHTFASQLVSAGVELYKVQKWLGHSDPKTTMIYAHLRPADDDIGRF